MKVRLLSLYFLLFFVTSNSAVYALHSQTIIDTTYFQVNSEGFLLDAKLLKSKTAIEPVPVLVFLVGSGKSSSVKNYQDLTQYYLDDQFLGEQVAIAYFDKRGIGKSEGKWYETTFEQRALDVKNVALALRKNPAIDSTRIYLVGHSQGGWIVQVALASYQDLFAGGISMAGPTFSVKRQIINDYYSAYKCQQEYSDKKALRKARNRVNKELLLVSAFAQTEQHHQLNVIKKFTPDQYLRAVRKPLLLLWAENDRLVNPVWAQQALEKLYPSGIPNHISVSVAQHQNHSFQISPLCYRGKQRDLSFSPDTRNTIKQWFEKVLASK